MTAKRKKKEMIPAKKEIAVAKKEVAQAKKEAEIPEVPTHHRLKGRLIYLLLSLIGLLLFYPFLEGFLLGNEFLIFMATIIPISAFYAVSYDKKHILPAFTLAIPFITINWMHAIAPFKPILYLNTFIQVIFYGYISYVLLQHFLNAHDINVDMIFGAISVYLMIGIIFAAIFIAVETVSPDSFEAAQSADGDDPLVWSDFIYYSLVTLSTTGYGDVTPRSSFARSLSVLEATAGVFYVAILVAQLVGVYIIKRTKMMRKKKSV